MLAFSNKMYIMVLDKIKALNRRSNRLALCREWAGAEKPI